MNWATALRETALEYEGRPCSWGAYDCCQFVSAYWKRMTGIDHAAKFDYHNFAGAQKILREAGGIRTLFCDLLGDPVMIGPGALVLVSLSDDHEVIAPGVYTGYCVFLVHPDEGIGRIKTDRIVEGAWRPESVQQLQEQ